jgi:hypothetical protein
MKDYVKAIKWITGEIEEFEDGIERRIKAGLTIVGFREELEAMKEIKLILEEAQYEKSPERETEIERENLLRFWTRPHKDAQGKLINRLPFRGESISEKLIKKDYRRMLKSSYPKLTERDFIEIFIKAGGIIEDSEHPAQDIYSKYRVRSEREKIKEEKIKHGLKFQKGDHS